MPQIAQHMAGRQVGHSPLAVIVRPARLSRRTLILVRQSVRVHRLQEQNFLVDEIANTLLVPQTHAVLRPPGSPEGYIEALIVGNGSPQGEMSYRI